MYIYLMQMKTAKLLHNPNAGEGKYDKKELISLIEAGGYKCNYASTKKDDWDNIEPEVDFIVIAGGDGTIRKVVTKLLNRGIMDEQYPLAILPLGTANNISKSLNINGKTEEIIKSWSACKIKSFDIGRISGIEDHGFFLEGFGFGLFPNLMNKMKKDPKESEEPNEKLARGIELIEEIALEYEARECTLELDGIDHSGKFLLVEVMNTATIGPNLNLNPSADPGDGELEVIIIPEAQREKFIDHLKTNMGGKSNGNPFSALKARDIKIVWKGIHAHVDDEIIKGTKQIAASIELRQHVIKFLIP